MRMSWLLFVLLLFLNLTFNGFSEPLQKKKVLPLPLSPAVVVGTVFCDTCFQQDLSKTAHFISGATVAVECRDEKSSKTSFRQQVKTNKNGKFRVVLPFSVAKHVKKIERCIVKLMKSSEPFCSVASSATSSALHFKNSKNKKGIRIFSAGFFTFKPLEQPTLCTQKPTIFNNKKQFEIGSVKSFLPPLDNPVLPSPNLPKLPDLPPLPPLAPLPPLPPLAPLPPLPPLAPLPPLLPLAPLPPLPPLPALLPPNGNAGEQKINPQFLFPPVLPPNPLQPPSFLPPNPLMPAPVIPNPFQPPAPVIPNPFQPPAPVIPNPFQPPAPMIPNPFQPPAPMIPNPFQPPAPMIPNPFQPPAPMIPNPFQPPAPMIPNPFQPLPPFPFLTPPPPPPSLFPPFLPPLPAIPGIPSGPPRKRSP